MGAYVLQLQTMHTGTSSRAASLGHAPGRAALALLRCRRPAPARPRPRNDRAEAATAAVAPRVAASTSLDAAAAVLAAACTVAHARVGVGPVSGRPGLIAARDLAQGEEVLSAPFTNAFAVPFTLTGDASPRLADATALMLDAWQPAHAIKLPAELYAYLCAAGGAPPARAKEKMKSWLQWLLQRREYPGAAAAEAPDLWDLYLDALPRPREVSLLVCVPQAEEERWNLLSPEWLVRGRKPGAAAGGLECAGTGAGRLRSLVVLLGALPCSPCCHIICHSQMLDPILGSCGMSRAKRARTGHG